MNRTEEVVEGGRGEKKGSDKGVTRQCMVSNYGCMRGSEWGDRWIGMLVGGYVVGYMGGRVCDWNVIESRR